MKSFLRSLGPFVLGCLLGFDRLRFRGSKRQLCYPQGMMAYFSQQVSQQVSGTNGTVDGSHVSAGGCAKVITTITRGIVA